MFVNKEHQGISKFKIFSKTLKTHRQKSQRLKNYYPGNQDFKSKCKFLCFYESFAILSKNLNLFYNFSWAIEFTKLPNAKYKYNINITSLNSI